MFYELDVGVFIFETGGKLVCKFSQIVHRTWDLLIAYILSFNNSKLVKVIKKNMKITNRLI